ncbi:hypothetical protein PVAP13_1NG418438 [Panicum virgatum]|uniref:Uncharacterized protein n=1 Tax=Panicum virgatum TaxID=38727 RepID=A0A8T0X563_PANVG|nr:hypothetical protein PVAP13_1NG418438 [Panicum virgatum]KAG2653978.1 hypothetical protein PVAP13_1NG418438 [Panicum virgatum]
MTCRPLSMLAANALACGIARMRSFVRAACAAAACETSTGRQVLRFGYTMASSSHAGSQMASSSWPVRLLCMVHIGMFLLPVCKNLQPLFFLTMRFLFCISVSFSKLV